MEAIQHSAFVGKLIYILTVERLYIDVNQKCQRLGPVINFQISFTTSVRGKVIAYCVNIALIGD